MRDAVEEPSVRLSIEGATAFIELNRPGRLNAIDESVRTQLADRLLAAEQESRVAVVVLHGAGERGFCAGADIGEARPEETAGETRARMRRPGWVDAFDAVTKPLIAAVHGWCMGGGLEMALACDIRMASPDAVFALPEVNLGLIPGAGGTQRLSRLIGLGRAMDMLLTSERIDAAEALRIGLVTRVTASRETLLDEARTLAATLATKPPLALRYVKEAGRASAEMDLASGRRLETDLFTLLSRTDDRREAAAAFREKRPGRFVGA